MICVLRVPKYFELTDILSILSEIIFSHLINFSLLRCVQLRTHHHHNTYLCKHYKFNFSKKIKIQGSKIRQIKEITQSIFLPAFWKVNAFGEFWIINKWIPVSLKSVELLISVLLPFWNLCCCCFIHQPRQCWFREVFGISTIFIAN